MPRHLVEKGGVGWCRDDGANGQKTTPRVLCLRLVQSSRLDQSLSLLSDLQCSATVATTEQATGIDGDRAATAWTHHLDGLAQLGNLVLALTGTHVILKIGEKRSTRSTEKYYFR